MEGRTCNSRHCWISATFKTLRHFSKPCKDQSIVLHQPQGEAILWSWHQEQLAPRQLIGRRNTTIGFSVQHISSCQAIWGDGIVGFT